MTKPTLALTGTLVLALSPTLLGGEDAFRDFTRWFQRYRQHRVDLYQAVESGYAHRTAEGGVRVEYYQSKGIEELDARLEALRTAGGERAARLLLDASVHVLDHDPATERRRFVAQQPWIVRRRAAETLAELEGAAPRAFLRETALRDRAPLEGEARRRTAAATLGLMGDEEAAPALVRLLGKDAAPSVRAAAATSLGRVGGADAQAALEAALADEDHAVRLEALLALDRRADATDDAADEAADDATSATARLEAARRLLNDPSWSNRHAAARLLGEHPDPGSIPPLLAALIREAPLEDGTRRRVRAAIRETLGTLTGQEFPATRPDEWVLWWEENHETFDLPAADAISEIAPEQGSRFFGIPVEADEVVFLVDVSGSMDRPVRGGPDGPSRLFVARRELRRCLDSLEEGTRFNLVLFHEEIVPFRSAPVAKDATTMAAAVAFVDAAEPDGGTNLFGALEFALRGGGTGSGGRRLLGDELDTIVVLTDGKPSRGSILVPEEILHQVEASNRDLRIAIHTVTAGPPSPFLERLAGRNFGHHAGLDD